MMKNTTKSKAAYTVAYAMFAMFALLLLGKPGIAQAYQNWTNVAMGGAGCWVTGFASSSPYASTGTLYARTDVGGAFRRNPAYDPKNPNYAPYWTAITDGLPFEHRSDCGIESIAVNPYNGKEVYIATGLYEQSPGHDAGTIYKSTDAGAHWQQSAFPIPPALKRFDGTTGLSMGGNEDRRWGGERLACDPAKSGYLLFGSRSQGLWLSTNDAATWTQVPLSSVPAGKAVNGTSYGVTAVAYDPGAGGVVYAAVEGIGLYRSSDHGQTWSQVSAVPNWVSVRRMVVGIDDGVSDKVWMTYGANTSSSYVQGSPPYFGGVAEYDPAHPNSAPVYYDPVPGGAGYFTGLAVNPYNPKDVMVAASTNPNIANPNATVDEATTSTIWHTTNEGTSWTQVAPTLSSPIPWSSDITQPYCISALLYDPNGQFGAAKYGETSASVWYCDGLGIWQTTNGLITGSSAPFYQQAWGHEQLVVNGLTTPPQHSSNTVPELLCGVLDRDGFAFQASSLSSYPQQYLGPTGVWASATASIAYLPQSPQNMARIAAQGNDGNRGLYLVSNDSGAHWRSGGVPPWITIDPNTNIATAVPVTINGYVCNFTPLKLAIDPYQNAVIIGLAQVKNTNDYYVACYYSKNAFTGSTTWAPLPGFFQPQTQWKVPGHGLAYPADIVDVDNYGTFYAINAGSVFSITLWGNQSTCKQMSSAINGQWGTQKLQVTPNNTSGDLWYSAEADTPNTQSGTHTPPTLGWEGLYHSTNGGQNWTQIPSVTRCISFSLGCQNGGTGNWPIYYYGQNSSNPGVDTIYKSMDYGRNWTNILDPNGAANGGPMLGAGSWWLQASMQTYGRVFVGTSGRGIFYSH